MPDNKISKDVLRIEENRKIPQVKSYNMATSQITDKCVYIRDSSCSFCDKCLVGDMLNCTSTKNGNWKKYIIKKDHLTRKFRDERNETNEDTEDEEFYYDSSDSQESESSDDEENITSCFEDLSKGNYVLLEYREKKYYVGSIVEYSVDNIVLKLARLYGVKGKQITFVWPHIDHVVVVENLTEGIKCLPDPVADRRGSSLIFNLKSFGKLSLKNIC